MVVAFIMHYGIMTDDDCPGVLINFTGTFYSTFNSTIGEMFHSVNVLG